MLAGYSPTIEAQMRAFYQSLSEKDRRRYAAIEACKLGHGGHSYMRGRGIFTQPLIEA